MAQDKNDTSKNFQLIGIVILVLIVSFAIGNYLNNKQSNLKERTNKEEVSESSTNVRFVTESTELAVGETTTVTVMLEGDPVQAVDVAVNYDPDVVTVSNIQNGTVYPDILRSDIADGQAIVSAAADPGNPDDLNTGELFTFTVEALAQGNTSLSFDPGLTITAHNGVNTLNESPELVLSVN